MRLRRAFLGLVILGVAVVLVLGAAGVFQREPESSGGTLGVSVPDHAGEYHMKGIRMVHDHEQTHTVVTAPEGRADPGGDRVLMRPKVEMTHADGAQPKGKTLVRASADRGFQSPQNENVIRLKGHVVALSTGVHTGTVEAEDVTWDTAARRGHADGRVAIQWRTPEGMQFGWCRGAEADMVKRQGSMHAEVRLLLRGYPVLSEAIAPADGSPAEVNKPRAPGDETPIEVRCDGPLSADGVARTALLQRNVRLSQGGAKLFCGRLELAFGKEQRQIDQAVAVGEVRFAAPKQGVSGQGDRLVRDARKATTEVTGQPARLQAPGMEIASARVVLGQDRMEAPGAGRLDMKPAKDAAAAGEGSIEWQGRMRFLRARNYAEFERDVVFRRGGEELRCQRLELHLAADGATAKRVVALGGAGGDLVVLRREKQVLRGDTVEIWPGDQAIRITGAGSADIQQQRPHEPKPTRTTVTWVRGMSFRQQARQVIFQGKVVMKPGAYEIHADEVVVFLDKAQQIERGEARRNVSIRDVANARSATGQRLEWDVRRDVAKLWGTDESPAYFQQEGGRAVPARWFEFSNNFQNVSMRAPTPRTQDRPEEPKQAPTQE